MSNPSSNKDIKVIVGLSGGVDSSVAAWQLLQSGYQVEGLFMKNWEEDDTDSYCSATEDLQDVEAVSRILGIPFSTINFSAEYWDRVFEYFLAEYKAGRTPNPDVLCNREIKFKAFLDHALDRGAQYIATGHYARSRHLDHEAQLLKGMDPGKDQSYFLALLNQHQLQHALFPIGAMQKPEVRDIARKLGLPNHDKKDSTGICFIGERPFRQFLQTYLPAQPGNMVTPEGNHIGEHQGLMYYTIGQRQGLGIGGIQSGSEDPWYVVDKNLESNELVVAQGNNHPLLFRDVLHACQVHWISGRPPATQFKCTAKTRYRQSDQASTVELMDNDSMTVRFEQPQRAVTPGQYVVLYNEDICLGAGVITGKQC